MSEYIINNGELYHYGVKGMKWGVRRYRKKDGSLTSAGKKRYNDTDSDQDSTKRKLSTEQKVAIGAISVAAALGVYGAYKLSNSRYFDRTIKAGKDFCRQGHANESVEGLNELVYATFKKKDTSKYAQNVKGQAYKIYSNTNTKIAGNRTAEKIYKDLLKNNDDFRKHYGHMSYKDFNGSLGFANKMIIEQNKLHNKTLNDTYMSPFFDALAKKGYNAVVDTQDKFAKVPVILINTTKDYQIRR